MGINLSEFKKNIISWYPIENNDKVLQIGEDEEITRELKSMTSKVMIISNIDEIDMNLRFDYITMIGSFDNVDSEAKIVRLLNYAKEGLSNGGKILLAMKNKFGMKYWTGEKFSSDAKAYETIESSRENAIGYTKIKEILDSLKLKYKFYYPLPDYKLTNVIFTDDYMPSNDSIDSRVLTYCENEENLNFSEREAYKQLIENDAKLFPFFSNSFFIEIGKDNNFKDIKYVSYSITRKKQYRIQTVIGKNKVYKTATTKESMQHIRKIENNVEIIKNLGIECLDKVDENVVISKYLRDAKSFDRVLMETYEKNGLEAVINKIKDFKLRIIDQLIIQDNVDKTVFDKYGVDLNKDLKEKLNFTKEGVLDLIFQNCLVKDNKLFVYDQEWYEEYVPIEFILYRAIFYFTELKKEEDITVLYKELGLDEFIEVFDKLENRIQDDIIDEEIWEAHSKSIQYIGHFDCLIQNYEDRIHAAEEHIENLETNIKEFQQGINDLTALIQTKDVELVNYANELRAISGSLSWKITKPLRLLSWMLNPKSGASFIDRIMPPGGKRRIKYDKKQTEKKYKRKVKKYFKLSDKETAEYWKGLDHRKFLKYEKDLEKEVNGELSDYEKWIKANTPNDQEIEKQQSTKFKLNPKISIVVPLYNTDVEFFRELLYSVHNQTYSNWELCLADGSNEPLEKIKSMVKRDKRIKYKFLGENKGISENTNEAIKLATGDYIALLDHDDILDITALFEVVKVINEDANTDFIYSDEDKFHFIDEPYFAPHFKPDYAPDTLRAINYICHLSVFKKSLLEEIGGFKSEYNGAQDYDIILRATEQAKKIVHISKVLYHWRIHEDSTAMNQDAKPYTILAGKKAIEEHLTRVSLKGKVAEGKTPGTYLVDYEVIGNPKISILIPNKDGKDILEQCLESIFDKTTYDNYEIVIIENNSETEEIFEYYEELKKNPKVKIIEYKEKGFNYSRIINFGVKNSDGEYIIQLNNDTELITPNWLERMLGFCQREDVGAVGVKLYYPDKSIQHAGVIVGCLQVAAHVFRGLPYDKQGYFSKENMIQDLNAVTAACIMTKKSIYEEVGYMNEEFAVAFNDIDFCLNIRKTGKLIVYHPYVEFTHFESKTRGSDMAPDKVERFQREVNLFLDTWKEKLTQGDEYYNINLSLNTEQYDIRTDKVL